MSPGTPALLAHVFLLALVICAALALGLGGEISGGEALAVIGAAGGVGVAGALGVSIGSKSSSPGP